MKVSLVAFILIFLLTLSNEVMSQNKGLITDTIRYSYKPPYGDSKNLDSIIHIHDFNDLYDEWEIYFDKNEKQLAYKSVVNGDTCIKTDYWRSGLIKKRSTYIKDKTGFYHWECEEEFCSNGQKIVEWCPALFVNKTLITRYYCNGNKQAQWTAFEAGIEDWYFTWYENGQMSEKTFYVNNKKHGRSQQWDSLGNITTDELYQQGKLVLENDNQVIFSLAYQKSPYNDCSNSVNNESIKTLIDSTFGFQIDYSSKWQLDSIGSDGYTMRYKLMADTTTATKMFICIDDTTYSEIEAKDMMKTTFTRDSLFIPFDNDTCLWYNLIVDELSESYVMSTYFYYSKKNQRFYSLVISKSFKKEDDIIIDCFFKHSLESFRSF